MRSAGLLGVLFAIAAGRPSTAAADPVRVGHVQVDLIGEAAAVGYGRGVALGLRFLLDPGWHIYWINAGDSGEAPRVRWDLPKGFRAQAIKWPAPRQIRTGPLMNFGYEGGVLLPAAIDAPVEWPPDLIEGGDLEFKARASWLVCKQDCIPGAADLSLRLPIRFSAAAVDGVHAALFAETRRQLPVETTARVRDEGSHLVADVVLPAGDETGVGGDARYTFFPFETLMVDHPAPQAIERRGDGLRLRLKKDQTRSAPLQDLAGIVVADGNRVRRSFSFAAPIERAAGATITAATAPATAAAPPDRGGLWPALAFAFLGGLLLNLMPCVFPVLSLKILGICEHAADPRTVRRHGWAYTAGVVTSFWALAGVLLAIRAGSARLGWGFQLQSPVFVALLAILLFVMAINLLGAFEVGLSLTRLGGIGGNRRGFSGSFLTGVLATVVATPCTAPFMGGALGYALVHSAPAGFAVFTALALGMAAPYLALGYSPPLLARLPRPGRWMEILRQAMSFPLFATVVWLLAVFSRLADPDAVFKLMAGLLAVAAGGWIYGRYQTSARRPVLALGLALAIGIGGVGLGVTAAGGAVNGGPAAVAGDDGFWEPWSAARVAGLRAEGKPVFVNFTAAWCISCKANEIIVFAAPEIRKAFLDRKVTALKADWTNRNDEIALALQAHGRAGVPLYLYYPAGRDGDPDTLPSLLTRGIVLAALDSGR